MNFRHMTSLCQSVSGSANKPAQLGTIHQDHKIVRFQNGFNKVVIELSGAQFWSEIILVISVIVFGVVV